MKKRAVTLPAWRLHLKTVVQRQIISRELWARVIPSRSPHAFLPGEEIDRGIICLGNILKCRGFRKASGTQELMLAREIPPIEMSFHRPVVSYVPTSPASLIPENFSAELASALTPRQNFPLRIQLELSVKLTSPIYPTPLCNDTASSPVSSGLRPSLFFTNLRSNSSAVQSSRSTAPKSPSRTTKVALRDEWGPHDITSLVVESQRATLI
ncbi:cation or drug efflux system protein [Striga asiatica]|uniref:Cation or drug efflux system protein n=1 Tax=Striga asiatica TaxID=4170 RepID=A0A5A7RD42_STRAF|nr:cation or drug efflux system protein [Striga asiatica]